MNLIDVHIITFDETKEEIERCLASLDDQPINIYMVDGIKEWPPVQGRAKGYAMGNAPFVSYVDPDDFVYPGCYETLLSAISDKDAAYGFEDVYRDGVKIGVCVMPHHAFLLRRGLDIDYSSSFRVFSRLSRKQVVEVKQVLYRHHRGSNHA